VDRGRGSSPAGLRDTVILPVRRATLAPLSSDAKLAKVVSKSLTRRVMELLTEITSRASRVTSTYRVETVRRGRADRVPKAPMENSRSGPSRVRRRATAPTSVQRATNVRMIRLFLPARSVVQPVEAASQRLRPRAAVEPTVTIRLARAAPSTTRVLVVSSGRTEIVL